MNKIEKKQAAFEVRNARKEGTCLKRCCTIIMNNGHISLSQVHHAGFQNEGVVNGVVNEAYSLVCRHARKIPAETNDPATTGILQKYCGGKDTHNNTN